MRLFKGILSALVALAALAVVLAKTPPSKVSLPVADSPDTITPIDTTTSLYRYCEAIKQISIYQDTLAARKLLKSVLRADSTYAPAQYLLSKIDTGEEATRLARLAANSDSLNRFYAENLGQVLIANNRYKEATEVFAQLVLHSTNIDHFRVLFILYSMSSRYHSALAVLDSAEVRFGRHPAFVDLRQELYMKVGMYDKAMEEAEQMVADAPYIADGYLAIGEVAEATNRDSLATAAYRQALQFNIDDPVTLNSLARFFYTRKEFDNYFMLMGKIFDSPLVSLENKLATVKTFTSDLRFYRDNLSEINKIIYNLRIKYPESREVEKALADHLIAIGELDQLAQLYKQRLTMEPTVEDFKNVIALEKYLQHTDSVAQYLFRAAEVFPEDFGLMMESIYLFIDQKAYDEASQLLRKLVKHVKGEECSQAWLVLGEVEHQRGNMKECFKAFKRSLKYQPDNAVTLNNYAYFLSEENIDLEHALKMAEQANSLSPGNATYLDTHAWVLYRLGRFSEAKRIQQQALSFDNRNSADLALHYGDILAALGEDFMAKTYWRKALERGADASEIEARLNGQKTSKPTN